MARACPCDSRAATSGLVGLEIAQPIARDRDQADRGAPSARTRRRCQLQHLGAADLARLSSSHGACTPSAHKNRCVVYTRSSDRCALKSEKALPDKCKAAVGPREAGRGNGGKSGNLLVSVGERQRV
eukprot:6191296-Pleurochrysis_carterae.AAC.2